jgi:hypothetical protein
MSGLGLLSSDPNQILKLYYSILAFFIFFSYLCILALYLSTFQLNNQEVCWNDL